MPRRLAALALVAASCATEPQPDADADGRRYLDDASFRHAELAASLVNHANAYSRTRLARYAAWEELPDWNPRVNGRALVITDAARAGDRTALRELGAAAFVAYPAQQLPPEAAHVDGEVAVAMADGTTRRAYTCATCHEADGAAGVPNASLDLGRILADAVHDPDSPMRGWGPGRADVSSPTKTEPVRIPDLRATRYQLHLQIDATVAQRSIASLALRIETLLVTGHGEIVRPPREVALGLAVYLWSLAPPLPTTAPPAAFVAACGHCHASPGLAGPPVPLAAIGTDAIGLSPDRGTGTWRVPSLVGVHERARLFHDGSVASLAALLDPGRVGGHHVDLDATTRAELLHYLESL
jgi:mono/diheme cytochrome c family protein